MMTGSAGFIGRVRDDLRRTFEYGFVGEVDVLAFGKAAEQGGCPALCVDGFGVVDAVLDEFAGAVMLGDARQIRAGQIAVRIAPAVVLLQLEQQTGHAPIVH